MLAATLYELARARREKRPVALATRLDGKDERLIFPDTEEMDDPLLESARGALRTDKGSTVEIDGAEWFVNPFNPPLRLLIVGAVHIAQALSSMARTAGYDVTVIDPRTAFASEDRFPGIALVDEWPDEAMERLAPDTRTAVVTLTHDPKLDDPALHVALTSPCFYIGALGSKKTQGTRVERLKAAGFDEAAIERIHGPVGLAIGGRSPAEIAISILAQMTAVLRG